MRFSLLLRVSRVSFFRDTNFTKNPFVLVLIKYKRLLVIITTEMIILYIIQNNIQMIINVLLVILLIRQEIQITRYVIFPFILMLLYHISCNAMP